MTLGYLSYDFRDHPVADLIVGAMSFHDRVHFNVTGFSYGPNDDSAIRHAIALICDSFVDIERHTDFDAALLIHQAEVHILVDLMGHTKGSRLGISALYPAPIIVNYLGYPGTMGALFTNFIIIDSFILPVERLDAAVTEKAVYLPSVYQINQYNIMSPIWTKNSFAELSDAEAEVLHHTVFSSVPDVIYTNARRTAVSSSPRLFIFCDFNTHHKMEPRSFHLWMQILSRVPASILWLLKPSAPMRQVLQSEAAAAGIHPDRLLFAPIVDKTAHLSRLIFVDLFLDTLFYNAHTTAADALWMHVPIITFAGSTFASRVAGSLIIHLSEPDFTSILITHSVKEFEAVAVDIASPDQNQARFIALNLHLTRGTLFGSTFNTQATTSHLEASYQIMWDLTQGGTIPSPYHAMVLKKESTKRVISQSKRIEQYLSIIQSHFVASQWEIARAGYHRLVTADPTCVYALHNLGVTELKLGHIDKDKC